MVSAVWLAACSAQVPEADEARDASPPHEAVSRETSWEGELEVVVVDPPAPVASWEEYFVTEGRQRRQVVFEHGAPAGLRSGQRVKVQGREKHGQLVAQGADVDTHAAASLNTCGPLGVQRSLVILAEFPGMPRPGLTSQAVHDMFFSTTRRSLADYWSEVSEGRTTTTGDVVGWYTLDRAYSCSETSAMRDAAVQAVDADVDFTQYDRIFIVHPMPQEGCRYSGQATLSCGSVQTQDGAVTASTAWLVAEALTPHDRAVELVTHEAGHNLSLHHASTRDFGTEALGLPGTQGALDEYGDVFSTMGRWNLGHYAAPQKARIGWLAASSVAEVDGVDGTFTLAPVVASGGLKALKVRRRPGSSDWLWLEYRQPMGVYESTLGSQVFGGALVHYVDAVTMDGSHLLDFTPQTPSWTDPALLPGATWDDPYSTLSVTVDAATSVGLTVSIAYRQAACVRAPHEVQVTSLAPTDWPGGRPEFEVLLINRDSPSCAPSTFQLATLLPQGWGSDRVPTQRTVAASSSVYLGLQTYTPYTTVPGTYSVGLSATRDGHTVQGTASIDILARCVLAPPTVTVSPQSVTAAPGTDVTWTVSVTNNDAGGCDWVWYDFYSSLPARWDTDWSDWGVNLPPGGAFTFTMTKSIPSTARGSHTVDLSIVKDEYGTVWSDTFTVDVAEPLTRAR
ncbi:Flagellar hook-length control protein FliK [Myxococcus hansupus]|uniref:Flagellar hook-length control protein FliK n=1 Tax=Pseudomyxococcus hansupus TaxID=1297742 RepID=A0A0H4X5T2_9BACT|nr:Flagellar hook-length control protein FliK [Myxococcus hansupus]